MVYDPDEEGYVDPRALLETMQKQYNKPLALAKEVRTKILSIESDTNRRFQEFFEAIAIDCGCSIDDVIKKGEKRIRKINKKEELARIERYRKPNWYRKLLDDDRSILIYGEPSDFNEETYIGPFPIAECTIQSDLAKIDSLIGSMPISTWDIIVSWDLYYSGRARSKYPVEIMKLCNAAKDAYVFKNWFCGISDVILSTASALVDVPATPDPAQPIHSIGLTKKPIPWAFSEQILRRLFEYLAGEDYVHENCVNDFETIVLPHFMIQGKPCSFPYRAEKIQWRESNVNLLALFEGIMMAEGMSYKEYKKSPSLIMAHFIDHNGEIFKPGSLRVQMDKSKRKVEDSEPRDDEVIKFQRLLLGYVNDIDVT